MRLHQPMHGAAATLFEYARTVPVIDTHEHVPRSEKDYNSTKIRFGDLFIPYVINDLHSAGMPLPPNTPPAAYNMPEDWDKFAPYWEASKHGSYARSLRLALQRFYGVDDFTRENYRDILRRVNENNRPGIFKTLFTDACNIQKAIRCALDLPGPDDPVLKANVTAPSAATTKALFDLMTQEVGASPVKTLDELIEASDRWMELKVFQGAIEFKSCALPGDQPDRAAAEAAFARILKDGQVLDADARPLVLYMRDVNAKKAGQLGVPVALHTGVWFDFRALDVKHLITFIMRHPETRMDIYHLGIPSVRDALQVVKNFPNAYLNLCWAHIVAPDMVVQTLKEAVDMVPMNKIFAFGGDYILFIEKVYGHLHIAKENVALALGDRVDRNLMDIDEAKQTLHAWFYDNPKRFYGL